MRAQDAAANAAKAEKVVFTFENDEKMREFTKLWQQRQGIVVGMSVLQSNRN